MSITLSKLRHVVAVDRLGSFTAAAEEVRLSQSSITKSVAQVEDELGYSLFDRRARGASATENGREFLDRAARIVADVDGLGRDVASQRARREEVLRVGVAPPSLVGLLSGAVRTAMRRADNFSLQLQAGTTDRLVGQLRQGDLDLVVGPTDGFAAEFEVVPLPDLVGRTFVRRGHPLFDPDDDRPLSAFPIILPNLSAPDVARLLRRIAPTGEGFATVHVLDSFPMVSAIVATTDAIGVVATSFARTARFRNAFAIVDQETEHSIGIGVARRARWMSTRPMQSFIAALKRHPVA